MKRCFVIMPFGKEGSLEHEHNLKIYKYMIKPAVEECGYSCIRADEIAHAGSIPKDIIEHLFNSDLVVADLTQRNANVFYELGVRHALIRCGTIPIIREGEELPFNLSFIRVTRYSINIDSPDVFKKKLIKRIKAFEIVKYEKCDNPVYDTLDGKLKSAESNKFVSKAKFQKLENENKNLNKKLEAAKKEQQQILNTKKDSEKEIEKLKRSIVVLQQKIQSDKIPKIEKNGILDSINIFEFRATPKKLEEKDVKEMLKQYNFYCEKNDWSKEFCNPSGTGIKHNYKIRKNGSIIYDTITKLMWQQCDSSKDMNYKEAKEYIQSCNREKFAGFNDWRLPTLEEAMSLMEKDENKDGLHISNKFCSNQYWIWTADEIPDAPSAWVVSFTNGSCLHHDVKEQVLFVRCVRSALSSDE